MLKTLGKHLTVELWGCRGIDSEATVVDAIHRSVKACNVTLRDLQVLPWEPHNGVSAIGILAESHISIHTWPEYGYAAVDVFTCGDHAVPEAAVPVLQEIFAPERMQVMQMSRGVMVAPQAPAVVVVPLSKVAAGTR